MSLSIKGRITKVLTLETGTSKAGKSWEKQSFVLDTGAQYNPEVCFSVFGDEKVKMLENFGQGQEVEVVFNVSSREFNGQNTKLCRKLTRVFFYRLFKGNQYSFSPFRKIGVFLFSLIFR